MKDRELELVNCFMVPELHERYEILLNSGKRKKIIQRLSDGKDLNMAYAQSIKSNDQNADCINQMLRRLGALPKCYVMSENPDLDGREMLLCEVLNEIVGIGMGTLVSCVPERLGYFEGEIDRFILQRPVQKLHFGSK